VKSRKLRSSSLRSFPFSGLAVAMGAASAGTAVAAAGVFSLLVLADQIANNEKDYSK